MISTIANVFNLADEINRSTVTETQFYQQQQQQQQQQQHHQQQQQQQQQQHEEQQEQLEQQRLQNEENEYRRQQEEAQFANNVGCGVGVGGGGVGVGVGAGILEGEGPRMTFNHKDMSLNHMNSYSKTPMSVSTIGKDGFQACMDVSQFRPNELAVKVLKNCVVVEGRHAERPDIEGYVSRHFIRRFFLPKCFETEKVVSTLSTDGVLTVNVPKPDTIGNNCEQLFPLQQVGPTHMNIKEYIMLRNVDENLNTEFN